jgi:hypothetical protein
MKSDALISHIAAQMVAEHGLDAERAAIELSGLMINLGERERQVEWLRVRIAIVMLRGQSASAVVSEVLSDQ